MTINVKQILSTINHYTIDLIFAFLILGHFAFDRVT